MDSSNPSQTLQRSDNAQSLPEQQTPVTNSAVQAIMDQPTDARPPPEHAYWAEIEEDLSVPDEAEVKEIESKADNDASATKYDHWEKTFYPDLGDPEYKPVEKARLSWKLKGVRGTKECPNWATVMRSPPAYISGYWWTIKFFPRGNKANSLSIYLECSSTMPTPDRTLPESEFKVLRGAPDATLNDCTPDLDLKTEKTDDSTAWLDMYKSKYPPAAASQERSQTWRVAAQVAVIIYNPDEPRTAWMQFSCHQFNPHNLDWGWTDFHGPWDKVHVRQRGQRQPLLRNDTLAFDAYIRIIDDPTHSLWWHRSVTENTWDSLGLTGYRPLGDSGVNHRAEVAGLASWLHIAPFCKIIQSVDVLEHLANCEIKPKPLCDALQRVLWTVRSRSGSQYVDTDVVTATLRNLNEYSSDVSEFWERLRRGLELELAGTKSGEEFAKLFDSPSVAQLPGALEPVNMLPPDYNSRICVQADEVKTTGEALAQYFSTKPGRWALPPVLNIELNRHKLDQVTKQWRLLYNRVDPDEELDLTEQVAEGQCGRYVLYGYVVHRGRRTSGKFFSILRPGGPGTRWFAFDDGSDKRVECLTRKTALGPHLGLDASKKPDQKTGHDVAVVIMYIRSDVVGEFLPGPQGQWDAPEDMREYYETGEYPFNKTVDGKPAESDLQVEVYSLPNYDEMGSLFDTYDLMSRAKSSNNAMYLSVPRSSTFVDLRNKVSLWKSSGGDAILSEHVRLWQIGHTLDRHGPTLAFSRVSSLNDTLDLPAKVARFWMQVVSGEEAKYFAMPDPPKSIASAQKPMLDGAVVEQRSSQSIHEVDDSVDPALLEQSSGTVSNDGQSSAPTPPSSVEGNPDSDAVFARRIANEIRQMDVAAASEAAQQQEQQPTPDATAELTIQTRSTEASEPATAVQLPAPHVYYFLQLFNADTQSLRTIGTFFSHANENIKSALLTHLPNPPKDIIIYQRTETTTLTSLSASETFNPVSTPDGTIFIVSERLSTEKRTSLYTAGNFSTPQPLITYLWASSRKHPTQSFTGTATLPASFSTDSYTGTLLKGHYHGPGTHITPLGSTYTGTFTFSLRHGHGTMTYPSGDTYEGSWAHDVPHGQGTYIEAKTGNKYVGGYKDGKRHGKGVSYWEVADEEADLCSICYGGEKDAVFIGCGHVCACVGCAGLVDLCPICRKRVKRVIRIYRA